MKTLPIYYAVFLLAANLCVPAPAERKPDSPKDAKLVVWATVEEVVRAETDEFNKFKVKIRVKNMERGFIRDGEKVVWADCFQRKPSASKVPSASGHKAIPKKGQFIRALLLEPRRGEFEGIYPDWFHELKLNDDQLAAMRWVQTIGSSKLGCDDSLPEPEGSRSAQHWWTPKESLRILSGGHNVEIEFKDRLASQFIIYSSVRYSS